MCVYIKREERERDKEREQRRGLTLVLCVLYSKDGNDFVVKREEGYKNKGGETGSW